MLQAEKTDRTHRELLNAAYTLFIEKGFDRTGIADIVALAGYSTGAFYRHYKSKSEVLAELWSDFVEEFIANSIDGAMKADSLADAMDFLVQRSTTFFNHPLCSCYYHAGSVHAQESAHFHMPSIAKDFTNMLYLLLRREYPDAEEARLRTYASALHAVIIAYSSNEERDRDFSFDKSTIREIFLLLANHAGLEPDQDSKK